jgi:uncharacterized membrane protein
MTGTMSFLIAAVVFFVGIHLLVPPTALRGILISRLGEGAYRGLFALMSILGLVWLGFAYGAAPIQPLWDGTGFRHLTLLIMPIAWILLVGGLTSPNPTAMGGERSLARDAGPRGFIKITRHPMMWAIALWALAHLLANGDLASLLLFGSLLFLALFGARVIDVRRQRANPPGWAQLMAQTSFFPFAALAAGRTRLTLRELGLWRLALGLGLYILFLFLHPLVIGVPALPG